MFVSTTANGTSLKYMRNCPNPGELPSVLLMIEVLMQIEAVTPR